MALAAALPFPAAGARVKDAAPLPAWHGVAAAELLRLQGSSTVGVTLAPLLLTAFGQASGLAVSRTVPGIDPASSTILMGAAETARQLRAEIVAHGTATAFPALRDKLADIGMASRRATEAELASVQASGTGDLRAPGNTTAISLDGVVVLVHPGNPLSGLTLDQLRAVFTGAVRNWSALGGTDLPISVYRRDDASGTLDTFRSLALGGGAVATGAQVADTGIDMADAVASDPGGIGFAGLADVRNAKPLAVRLPCGLTLQPTAFQVRTEEYPLSRRLLFYSPAEKRPVVRAFIQFAASDAAQPLIEKAGFVDFMPELADGPDRAARLHTFALGTPDSPEAREKAAEFQRLTEGWRRVSTTFRFERDRTDLDERARDDLRRVAEWVRGGRRQVVLIGYASSGGGFSHNVALSLDRAREVATRLAGLGVRPVQVAGMGPMGPVGCDDAETGGGLNRRVEVWVR